MSDIAIRAANLSKLYHIGRGQGKASYRTLRELWAYRELVMLFVCRDFVSVYKSLV